MSVAIVCDQSGARPRKAEISAGDPVSGQVEVRMLRAVLDPVDIALSEQPSGSGPLASSFPLTLGRHGVGIVGETCAEMSSLSGQVTVVPALLPCGECDACRRGRPALCARGVSLGRGSAGTMSTRLVLPGRYLLPLLGPLVPLAASERLSDAAAIGMLAELYQGMVTAQTAPGDAAVVVGRGTRAELLRRLLVAKGVVVLESTQLDTAAEEARSRELRSVGWKVFALDDDACERAAALLCPAVKLVLVGAGWSGSVDLRRLSSIEGQVLMVGGAHPDLYPEVAALLLRGDVQIPTLKQVPLQEVPAAFDGIGESAEAHAIDVGGAP